MPNRRPNPWGLQSGGESIHEEDCLLKVRRQAGSVGDLTRARYFQWLYDRQSDYGSSGVAFWNLGIEMAEGTDVSPSTPETWLAVESNAP